MTNEYMMSILSIKSITKIFDPDSFNLKVCIKYFKGNNYIFDIQHNSTIDNQIRNFLINSVLKKRNILIDNLLKEF